MLLLQDVQHILDQIRGNERLSISEDHANGKVELLSSLSPNFTESIKWIRTASQNLPPKQMRDPYML